MAYSLDRVTHFGRASIMQIVRRASTTPRRSMVHGEAAAHVILSCLNEAAHYRLRLHTGPMHPPLIGEFKAACRLAIEDARRYRLAATFNRLP